MALQRVEKVHSPTDRERLVAILTKRGTGSFLRGWRKELDPDGTFDINFLDFCSATQRLGFTGDAHLLFGTDRKFLNVEELEHERGSLLRRFREWMRDMFGGPVEMYSAFDVAGRTRLSFDMFCEACLKHGFLAVPTEFRELFDCCDINCNGNLAQEDVIFLESEKQLRELAVFKAKKSQKEKHLKLMCWAFREDGLRSVSNTHRLAQRPWLAENFAQLPMLVHHRRVEWQREANRRGLEARILFKRHLRDIYRNEVRAWRLGLDPLTKFQLTAKDIRAYCRKHDLNLDCGDLWKSLDKDCDGFFRLEELCVGAADVLASFQHWAVSSFGSTAAIWDRPEMTDAKSSAQGHWASQKKLLHTTFIDVLRALKWPAVNDPAARHLLLTSLDFYGCSFISCSDLEWLDKWRMPEWLCAEPDESAWEDLRNLILQHYKHPLKAWRLLLDTDNSNNVSWLEFKEACERIKFNGNIGGAWRALNKRLASSISMKDYDAASAELLSSFKDWAETEFGSVKLAFKGIDVNNTGKLSYQELKRACQNLKWPGEVRLLFDCLDLDGKLEGGRRFISMKEVQFLDEWEGDPGDEEQEEEDIVTSALAQSAKPVQRASSATSSLPSVRSNRRLVGDKVSFGCSTSILEPPSASDDAHPFQTSSYPMLATERQTLRTGQQRTNALLHKAYHRKPRPEALKKSYSLPWLKRNAKRNEMAQYADTA
mmetsp:Transcript_25591/g.41024  ORF Transcript_25591/g.41024 Transcript_25591/m.41024 type:complete len:711 (-) Transcript_25591:109-2241(-)